MKFVAKMRYKEENVTLCEGCEGDHLDLYLRIMGSINEGNHIEKLFIENNNEIIEEKLLDKPKVLRRTKK